MTGEPWKAENAKFLSDKHAYLAGPRGQKLFLHADKYWNTKDRIEITGELESAHVPYDAKKDHTITVSADKKPALIARDINRRLLPEYREVLAATLKRKEENEADDALRAALVERIHEAWGGVSRRNPKTHGSSRLGGHLGGYEDIVYVGEYEVMRADEVAFTVRIKGANPVVRFVEALDRIRREYQK